MPLFRKSPQLVSLADSRVTTGDDRSHSVPPSLDKHLRDYLRVLVKRRWLVLLVLVASLGLAAAHLYTAVPIYQAVVQILIEHESQNTFSLQESVAQDRETTDYYNTQFTILRGRSLAKRAIDQTNNWENPVLVGGKDAAPSGIVQVTTRWLSTTLARLRGTAVAAPGSTPATPSTEPPAASVPAGPAMLETPAQAGAIDAFLSRLTVAPVKTSRLVDLKMEATDPKFAADAANALARAYIDQNLEVRMSSSKETTDWLTQQLSEQRRRVEASENALQKYRETNDAISLADPKNTGGQNIVAQKLADLNSMVTRAKADRISREALYNQVSNSHASGMPLDTIPSILSNPYLQQLKADVSQLQAQRARLSQDLLDGHPEMVKLRGAITDASTKLQQELTKQVDSIKNEYEAARRLERDLTQALESQKAAVTELSRTGIDYDVLDRDATVNRQIFESLLQRTREKGIAGELRASDARIVDVAQVPRGAIWPNRNQTLLYAIVFGALLGVGLAFFAEYMDDRIKTPEELKTYLGLPFLGMIPVVSKKDRDQGSAGTPLLSQRLSPHFAEAFRALRTNVIFAAEQVAQSLVITSTGVGEGKTFVASNLALGLAMADRKVIIVDVDMRRPRLHDVYNVAQTPGLSDVLAGRATLAQAMRQLPGSNLWVMPSGGPTENPAEKLASPRFGDLLESLGAKFDWVLLDSPPVAAVTDACIVANRASAVLFVVGAQNTPRSAAIHAIEQLEAARATFLGAVLNQVHLKRDAYYYSSYYRPEYEKYFSAEPAAPRVGKPGEPAAPRVGKRLT